MASFGIGLGAFVDGMQSGMALRDRIDERNRTKANRAALDKIDSDAKAQFSEMVQDGQAKPDQFGDFWLKYALPRRSMELIRQGDIQGARALREWGESDAALQGGRLFSSALVKAQTGDVSGALDDAIKAGEVKGYLNHGYQLESKDTIQDENGNTLGFRLHLKTDKGDSVTQDIGVGDVGKMVAIYANPDAAWKSQQEAAAQKSKKAEELDTYKAKKDIDQQYGKPKVSDEAKSYRDVAADFAKNDLDWSSRSPEEQDKMVRERLDAAKRYAGQSSTPGNGSTPIGLNVAPPSAGGKVIVDQGTGQTVDPAAQTGLGTAPPAAAPAQQSSAALAPAGEQVAQSPMGPSKDAMIADAADYAAKGGNPETIAMRLMNAGVPEQDWPQALKTQLARQKPQGPAIGLGQ